MKHNLAGKRVLIVEDEYFLADDLARAIEKAGGKVVGPASESEEALQLIADQAIDIAVVDINLKGEAGFDIADALAARAVPFVFSTGYDADIIPERFARVRRWEKPFKASALVDQLA